MANRGNWHRPSIRFLAAEALRVAKAMREGGTAAFGDTEKERRRIKQEINLYIEHWLIPPLELLNQKLNKKGAKR